MEWRRYTYDRPPEDGLKLLGSIRKGLQVGALAQTDDGQYLLVVGDHETPLNQSQITKALGNSPRQAHVTLPTTTNFQAAAPPVVVVKKRRIIKPT